jgi:hypothetical protein
VTGVRWLSHAQRLAAVEAIAAESAPALGWKPEPADVPVAGNGRALA